MATTITKPVATFNGVPITDYYGDVRVYNFDALPESIKEQIVIEEANLIEVDCS